MKQKLIHKLLIAMFACAGLVLITLVTRASIDRNFIEAHGGQITAQPGLDGGLLITTTLPLET